MAMRRFWGHLGRGRERVRKGELVQKARYGPKMIDTAFLDDSGQRDPDVCGDVPRSYELYDVLAEGAGEVQVDDNTSSEYFKRLLSPSSIRLSSLGYTTPHPSRLLRFLASTCGDLKHDNHEDLARKLASIDRDGGRTFWRKEDMTAYNVFLEYAWIMSIDRVATMNERQPKCAQSRTVKYTAQPFLATSTRSVENERLVTKPVLRQWQRNDHATAHQGHGEQSRGSGRLSFDVGDLATNGIPKRQEL
ncbi:hypothetical protein EV421DRAFT_1736373 [Armillaria borealis]|uniref:Uncharacterized protein n=1 Tax=Armillaria borealis TaxID=47425 RepID=A0AA39MQ41_9AGAR|nr:hypothetical protein EV421DRAFT_1736373 [Armillaria borealis]